MRASDLITLQVYVNNQWVDYSDGLINLEIIRGVEEYTGPLSQPDVGQLTLKSRNANLDPYNNNNITYNSKIRVNAGGQRIFTGRIEGISVEYGPRTEPTIVTINAFDLIGTMYKHILSEEFIGLYESWDTPTLLAELSITGEVAEWQNYVINTDGTTYAEGPIDSNTTVFDALNTRSKTDLGFYFANARNEIEYYRRDSDDPLHPFNSRPAEILFDYDGNGESYRAISLNDGFEKIANEIVITGIGPTDTTTVVVTADDSVSLWGKSSAEVTLATDSIANLQVIGNKVLTEMAEPIREIYEITWDATLDPDAAKNVDIMDNIHINHVINPSTSIDRKYGVIGIKHEINYDEWLITYVVRNYDYQATSIPNPVIVITPESGGAEVDFTFTYTHPNPGLITGQTWNFDDGFTSTAASAVINYVTTGTKTITLTINTIYGYTKTTSVQLEVGIDPPEASFTYTLDANNVYNFAFTGSGLGQAYWDFGDGTASTDTNPSKFYVTGGTRTVTLTVANSFGVDVATQTISTVATSVIPVRYVRFKWRGGASVFNFPGNYVANWPVNPGRIFNLKFYDTANVELGTGYTLTDYKDTNGFFTTTPTTIDEYGRTVISPVSELEEKLKGSNGTYLLQWDAGSYSGSTLLDKQKSVVAQTTFDLQTNYFSFKEPKVTGAVLDNSVNPNVSISALVEVSWDNQNWRHIGELGFTGTSGTNTKVSTFTPVATAPFTFTNTTVPFDYTYTPIRYIRLDFNAPASTTENFWSLMDIYPMCGRRTLKTSYNPIGNNYPPLNNNFGNGGINTSARTGANLTLLPTNSSGINLRTRTLTGSGYNGTTVQSIVNPGASGITAWNNYYPQINPATGNYYPGSILNELTWQETTGEKTLVYDFGQPVYKFTGLYFNLERLGTSSLLSNAMNINYTVTVSHSIDNINWTTIGTFPFGHATKSVNTEMWVRVAGDGDDATSETIDADYYFRPVHSGTTWQQLNSNLLPNGILD